MKKNRLILALYLTAISLCIATFSMSVAWYASATHLQISTIDITVNCDKQLAIPTQKDSGYTDSLDTEDLYNPGALSPVTSAYQDRWINDRPDMPVFYNDTNYSEKEGEVIAPATKNGFFSQKLYLESDENVFVSINPEKTYIHPHTEINATYAGILYEEYQAGSDERYKSLTKEDIENRLNTLVKAMRMSILVNDKDYYQYAVLDFYKNETTYFGGILDNNVDRYYDYFRSSDGYSYERLYGEIEEMNHIAYLPPTQGDTDYEHVDDDPSAFNAKHKDGIRRIDFANSDFKIKEEQSYTMTDFVGNKKPLSIPVYRGTPTEIVLSIYIEGWDLESINYTMGATFIANLVLEIERGM